MDTLLITVDDDVRQPSNTVYTIKIPSKDKLKLVHCKRDVSFTDNSLYLEPIRGGFVSWNIAMIRIVYL